MYLIGILVLYFTSLLLLIVNDNDYWTTNSQTMPLALLLRNCELTRSENRRKVPFSSESPLGVNLRVVSFESCNRNTYCWFEALIRITRFEAGESLGKLEVAGNWACLLYMFENGIKWLFVFHFVRGKFDRWKQIMRAQ